MTAKLMMEKDVHVGLKSRTDNNSKKIETEKTTPEQEVKNEKKSLYAQPVTMEEFIEQRKKEYVFL